MTSFLILFSAIFLGYGPEPHLINFVAINWSFGNESYTKLEQKSVVMQRECTNTY